MEITPVLYAFLGTMFTWLLTAIGASVVFLKREIDNKILDASLGFSAGIMIAASIWSLLIPAMELSKGSSLPQWLPASIGFLSGGIFFRIIDKIIPHLHLFLSEDKAEGVKTKLPKTTLLVLAITMHNFPEGLAIGVAFGSISLLESSTLAGAIALTVGIGIQNLPEGMAISLPLRREGLTRLKSFWYGQLSAIVEPIGGILGAYLVIAMKTILPYALSFAAGAMIFVVTEELIPESQSHDNSDIATLGLLMGFTLMMILDVALG